MNTTAAAIQANVTVATIRTWCRRGVIAAVKTAGRWVIDSASLAARIAIGAMKHPRRREATPVIDLTATYTFTHPGATRPTVVTPKIRHREIDGEHRIIIRGLAPLLASHLDAIADEGDRLHTLTVLASANIVISDTPGEYFTNLITTRDDGRLATTYTGTRALPTSVVLDLAEQLRTQLA
ncbi:hypothetical protein TU94_28515 [Streptomyces cyaneogriseus subsp. noncyanogenus]|uniref:Uncharacterized protein n=1 Tax=Streptomyces cyaneogriseus subsp. noncyanogenus TaxID=477245 RepID=A0A0C5G473_9ACTN|nr:helix-turn-helix domain-containing protein [Streptomyces cyaneogriseus]AJP04803.1 hypothetical protein TU94_28515 [Streptomyces cyaneogriseus subsp. noncyanogenus]